MASGRFIKGKYRPNMPYRMHYYKFSNQICSYKGYKCPKFCIEGYQFCINHILEDERAPFQQCAYRFANSMKRCPQAATKSDGDGFCPEHLQKIQKSRNRAGKSQPPLSTEKLIASLGHYVKTPKKKPAGSEHIKVLDPFVDIDAAAANASLSHVLDYCSESDSDVDSSTIGRTIRCKEEDSSDAESVDSTEQDVMKFASVLTADEALQLTKEKSLRLQQLYSDQFRRLKHILRERRRDYLADLQKEKETLCSIAEQSSRTVRDFQMTEKLKAYNHYRKFYGVEAILRRKLKDKKRGLTPDNLPGRAGGLKCIFTEGGVKCSSRSLPYAKYCIKHILNDPHQVLIRPCGFVDKDNCCKEPLAGMDPCLYHMGMVPSQITYNTTLSSEEEETREENIAIKQEEVENKTKLHEVPDSIITKEDVDAAEVNLEYGGDIMNMKIIDPDAIDLTDQIIMSNEEIS